MEVLFKKAHAAAQLPAYATDGAAGADVYSVDQVIMRPGARGLIRTGLLCEVPKGFEIQVRPRSGIAFKNGITVLNAPGTIDSDYRGELCVLLLNTSGESFQIDVGDRIAQIVIAPVKRAKFGWVEELSETDRGAGGFGSTGVSEKLA